MAKKLFVDDIRDAPAGYLLARTIDEAKELLAADDIAFASLDHDLGACADCTATGKHIGDMRTPATTFFHWCPHVEDGVALATWMVQHRHLPPMIQVHSRNPIGRRHMMTILGLTD